MQSSQLRSSQLKDLVYRGDAPQAPGAARRRRQKKGKRKATDSEEEDDDDDEGQDSDDDRFDAPATARVTAVYHTTDGDEIRFTRS
ncbi:hypothetical protein HK405_011790, partial [Cladochytrium tenue]